MTRSEFARVIAYLGAGLGKSVSREQAEVYFDLLGDLPLPLLQMAARQALLESRYPTLPTPGALRQIALSLAAPEMPSATEAWGLVRRAIVRWGYLRELEALATLPEPARSTASALGWQALCDSTEPERSYAQFRDAYQILAARQQRGSLLPTAHRELLTAVLPEGNFSLASKEVSCTTASKNGSTATRASSA